ncbi:sensor histidine kinase [Aureliella helgolandensis]|uniref:histidine kinase n=1 Tax=Aureliella helgolandensis TaxID=2527968 RepID=A0A518G650_9BACT|nr:HAMP domain-containing sensor histidine kinase [Aureliella helgolandensis]QDV24044.1 Sporulation kinase D [Aureliella helgolandensis]
MAMQTSDRYVSTVYVTNAVARSTPHAGIWQSWCMPTSELSTVALSGYSTACPTHLRIDSADRQVRAPKLLQSWTAEIGWHRQLGELQNLDLRWPESDVSARPVEFKQRGVWSISDHTFPLVHRAPDSQVSRAPTWVGPALEGSGQWGPMVQEAAHDLRAPISSAQQILASVTHHFRSAANRLSPAQVEQQVELLEIAQSRLQLANDWAETILSPDRLPRERASTIRRRFYPNQWRNSIGELLESIAAQRGVKLEWLGWERSLARLYVDDQQLSRAALNLVSNAVAASPSGGTVVIRAAMQGSITRHFALSIEDEGAGMCRELLEEVNTAIPAGLASKRPQQLGVGLTITKALVRSLGGTLLARMTKDRASGQRGTTVRLSVPVDNPAALLRTWLLTNAGAEASARSPSNGQGGANIELHVLRATSGEVDLMDRHFQQSAELDDFVYRVAKDRWLWFKLVKSPVDHAGAATAPSQPQMSADAGPIDLVVRNLPEQAGQGERMRCFTQRVFRLRGVQLQRVFGKSGSHLRQIEIVNLLHDKFTKLCGYRVPAVDLLDAPTSASSPAISSGIGKRVVRFDPAHHAGVVSQKCSVDRWSERDASSEEAVRQFTQLVQQRLDASFPTSPSRAPAPASVALTPPLTADAMQAISEVNRLWRSDLRSLHRIHAGVTGLKGPADAILNRGAMESNTH